MFSCPKNFEERYQQLIEGNGCETLSYVFVLLFGLGREYKTQEANQ